MPHSVPGLIVFPREILHHAQHLPRLNALWSLENLSLMDTVFEIQPELTFSGDRGGYMVKNLALPSDVGLTPGEYMIGHRVSLMGERIRLLVEALARAAGHW